MSMTELEGLEECLADFGCSNREKAEILRCHARRDIPGMIRLLRRHRQTLLDRIHKEEAQISCLDYLVFQLEKKIETKLRKDD